MPGQDHVEIISFPGHGNVEIVSSSMPGHDDVEIVSFEPKQREEEEGEDGED